MWGRIWLAAAVPLLLLAAPPVRAGGGGPVGIISARGRVFIRAVDFRTGRAIGPWMRVKKQPLEGTYVLRTGRRSWVHLDLPFWVRTKGRSWYPRFGCVDSRSLVRIDSYADSELRVLRGRISPVDGKRAGRLPNHMGGI